MAKTLTLCYTHLKHRLPLLATMTLASLIARFNTALAWNAFLYLIYKISLTSLSFFLYYRLDSATFCAWTSINSTIFLLLLWLDFGLRKTIPRFTLALGTTSTHILRFITGLILFRLLIALLCLPLFWYLISTLTTTLLHKPLPHGLVYSAIALFIAEGLSSLMESIYHAYFMHKFFNSITSALLASVTIASFFVTVHSHQDHTLLTSLIALRAIGSGLIAFTTLCSIPLLFEGNLPASHNIPPEHVSKIAIARHAWYMWLTTLLKSLSERNALVPFFVFTLGPTTANAIKIANDAALLFYRTIVKTIGSADTSFLVHAYHCTQATPSLLLDILVRRVLILCLASFSCACGCLWYTYHTLGSEYSRIFCIFVLGYLIEVALSPLERMFEVQGLYTLLLQAFLPYISALVCLGLVCFLGYITNPFIIVILVQAIRVSSSLVLAYFFYKQMPLQTPANNVPERL